MELSEIGHMLLVGVLVPGIVSLVLMLLIWPRQLRGKERSPQWAGGLVVCLAFLSGSILLKGVPEWPVASSSDWLPVFALLGFVLGLFSTIQSLPPATVGMLRAIASIGSVWLATQSQQQNVWKSDSMFWLAGLSLLLFILWSMWEYIASRHKGALVPLLLTVNFTALALAALLGHSATVSQQAGVLCAAIGALFLVALLRPSLDLSQSTLFVAMPLFAVILINAHFYAYLSPLHAGLVLLCTPMAVFATMATKRMSSVIALIMAALITALPFIVSATIQYAAGRSISTDEEADPYADYYN